MVSSLSVELHLFRDSRGSRNLSHTHPYVQKAGIRQGQNMDYARLGGWISIHWGHSGFYSPIF